MKKLTFILILIALTLNLKAQMYHSEKPSSDKFPNNFKNQFYGGLEVRSNIRPIAGASYHWFSRSKKTVNGAFIEFGKGLMEDDNSLNVGLMKSIGFLQLKATYNVTERNTEYGMSTIPQLGIGVTRLFHTFLGYEINLTNEERTYDYGKFYFTFILYPISIFEAHRFSLGK